MKEWYKFMGYEEKIENRAKLSLFAYYVIIFIVSVASTVFLPLINSSMDAGWDFPTDSKGWVIWVVLRLAIAGINVCFFYCFMEQAKLNIRDDKKYIEANEIMGRLKKAKEVIPRSPKKWNVVQWTSKSFFLFLGSILSVVAFSNAILNFDLTAFLSYGFTVIMGLVFGFLQMKKAEDYWTSEYWHYAKMKEEEETHL